MKLVSAGLCVLYSDLRCGNLQFTLTIIFLEGKGARLNAVNFSATNSINVPFTTLKAKWCPNYKHCNITKFAFCSQWETKKFILGLKLTLSKLLNCLVSFCLSFPKKQ